MVRTFGPHGTIARGLVALALDALLQAALFVEDQAGRIDLRDLALQEGP